MYLSKEEDTIEQLIKRLRIAHDEEACINELHIMRDICLKTAADELERLYRVETRTKTLEAIARRALSLDRHPQQPEGGMQTGDMVIVGMRDWHRLLRLARALCGDSIK